jgi:predicted nucleic acid-binding protein
VIVVVADASPLIALERIGQLALLEALFGEILIPPAVAREVTPRLVLPPWIRERAPQHPIAAEVLRAALGPGESEAIGLALEIHADRLIVDERAGRRVAEALGLRVAGVLGLLVISKQRGLIPALRPQIESLLREGFRADPNLIGRVLRRAGEDLKL